MEDPTPQQGVLIVKNLFLSWAVIAALTAVFIAAGPAAAQQQPGGFQPQPGAGFGAPQSTATPNIGVVLVDINYIFKHHARLQDSLKGLRTEGETVQKGFEEK